MDPLTDPADWDVEEVVKVLCTSESRPWAEASNVPYPKLDDFAKALHENYITGEILLEELDKDSLRDELGIKPLGHRSGIMKAVEWLRSRSAKYQAKNAQFQQSTLVVSTEERDSPTPMAMSLGPTAQAPGTYPPQTPNTKETPRSPQAKRRIRPQLISTSGTCTALNESTSTSQEQPSSVTEHQASRTDQVPAPKGAAVTTETDKGTSSAPISTAPGITGVEQAKYEGMSKPLASTLEGDFYQQLLKRYPPGGEGSDLLPVYGDSGSEGEYDDSTLEEIEDEERDREEARTQSNAGEQPALPSLSREERLLLISQHVTAGNARWEETRLPKILHKARPMWLESERLGTRAQDKQDLAQSIASLETRMGKLQKALLEVDYHDSASFLKACANLDPTIHNMCLEKWNLATLECDQCPDPAQPPPKTPRTRKERPRPQEDESLTSESDPDSGEEIASNGIENDEDESMPIEGDDDVGNAKHQAFLARLPFSLESSSSASPRKKRRVHFGDKSQEDESASDADSTQPETSNPAKEEDLEISTPPLNAVSRLKLLGTRPPYPDEIAPIFGENKSHDPGDSTPCPVNDINRVPEPHDTVLHMDVDPALFDIVSRAEPADLAASQNRLHLLAWTITGLQTHEPGQIMKHLEDYLPAHLADNVHEALMAMQQNKWHLEDRDEAESMTILRLGALYLSWYHCMFLQSQGINPLHLQGTIDALESSEFESRFPEFLDTLRRLFSAYDNWRVRKPKSSLTTSGISPIPSIVSNPRDSSSRNRPATSISAKKPKTKFAPRYLSGMQKEAKLRQDRQDALRKDLIERGLSNHDPHKQAVTLKDPVIYLHRDIGKLVKPHQLAGIQFMWRELMEPERAQGCLLAHVMGLGKTMQVISVLVTIAAAVNSENPEIRKQIPEKFHRSQTIVLCPSAMVPNWGDEFAMWTPRDVLSFLGPIRLVVARNTYKGVDERMVNISAWMKDGGVLVMSYEMFRQFVMNTSTRTGSAREWLSDEEHRMLREALLDGPNIVVADEAHKIKNEKSAISQAAAGFKTMSRIALTGSPLANNLLEYFQMVDWVAPGYLESLSKFKEKFLEPIQSGSYLDSSPQQQRESLCALKILDGILQPKVLRADTSVIEGDLPPKTEYLIQVPLTKIQEEAYNLFVSQVQRGESHINRALYSWLALLQLCCNHPYPFREKLNNRIQAAEDAESHLPHAMEDAQLPTTLVSDLDVLFDKIDRLSAKDHSHRVRVLIKIIKKSKEAGDKVLVFTQSIPTMNYIEQVLKEYKCGFQRIDGAVPGINRQAATKSFNTDPKQHVLLISTKAGGLGLNMFGANRVVIFDFQFNPVHEEQAVGRAYRLGQTKPVFVYRFISAGTYEDSLFNKAQYKRQLAVRVVDKKTPAPEARKENRTLLHPVKNVVRGNFNGIQGTDPLVLDMILDKLIRNGSIVNVSFSHIRDDEKGNLTEAEKRHVANQLMLERLKRDDPQKYAAEMKKREDALKQMSQQQMALLQGTSAVVSQHLSGGPALPPALQELGMFRGTSALVSQPHAGGPPLPLTLAQNPPHSSSPSRPPALARYMPSSIPLAASSSATGGVVGYTPSSFFLQQTHASVDLEHQSGRQPGPLPPVHTAGDSARAPNSPIPVIDLTSSVFNSPTSLTIPPPAIGEPASNYGDETKLLSISDDEMQEASPNA